MVYIKFEIIFIMSDIYIYDFHPILSSTIFCSSMVVVPLVPLLKATLTDSLLRISVICQDLIVSPVMNCIVPNYRNNLLI